MIGARLGPYEVTAKLGEGGMGEVWRARDSKLKREVALKVLPAAFTADPERLARFEREAQLLAQLQHPNIASIYGLEESDGTRALVMELVEGEDLAAVIARGPLSVEEALPIARQIVEALEAAHEHGIVHRDLKPANVKLRADGTVKVLDFGLAKAMESSVASSSGGPLTSPTLMNSPTLTGAHGTRLGVILGSAAYMAPEQARGRAVDRRVDVWAFGAVLFELLTGQRAFGGDDVSEVIATVLKTEPEWSALPAATPPAVRRLLRRCLEKDPRRRLAAIADARLELEDAARQGEEGGSLEGARPSRGRIATLVALAAVAGVLVGALAWRALATRGSDGKAISGVARLSIVPPPGQELRSFDMSPDGATLALRLRPQGEGAALSRLYLRARDRFELTPVAESDGAQSYGFSPDGRWLYFVAPVAAGATQQRLARVPVDGSSAPVTVRRWDGDWQGWTVLPGGDILATAGLGHRYVRLPANGADPAATRPYAGDLSGAILSFMDDRLPDGSPLLRATHYGARGYQDAVAAFDLASGRVHLLIDDAYHGVPLRGQLLFGRGDALLVAPFDAATGRVTDAPRAVLTGLRTIDAGEPYPGFVLARNGTLVYAPGGRIGVGRRLVVVDAGGVLTPWSSERILFQPDLSVGGGRLAVTAMEPNGLLFEIWVADLDSRTLRRVVATSGADNHAQILSRDGSRVAFRRFGASSQDGLYVRSLDGAGEERRLAAITATTNFFPCTWSPDGSRLLARRITGGKTDLVSFALERSPGAGQPILASSFDETDAAFSPDGRSLAFVTNETGRNEVYVAPLRADGSVGPSTAVSAGPGQEPRWRPDGRALFFWDGQDHILSVPVITAQRVTAGPPQALLDLPKLGLTEGFQVLPDGRLIVVARGEEEADIQHLDVVLGFTSELESAGGKRP